MAANDRTTGNSAIDIQRETRRLPVRLMRDTPWGRSIGCALLMGLLLTGFSTGMGLLISKYPPQQDGIWIPFTVVGFFGLVGVFLVVSGIHQWFASRVRETILEIDKERVRRGSTLQVCLRQEGPVTLTSLRANVRCLERRHTWNTRSNSDGGTESYRTTDEKELWTQNILDEQPGTIPSEEFWEKTVSFSIPEQYPASLSTDELDIVWKIEVWGRVARWPDFMHPYAFEVD